jgi:hypothetical protein
MSQNDMAIADQNGAAFLADVNSALAALVSNNSGASAPATTYAYMWWPDTGSTPPMLRQRNAADTAWIPIGPLEDLGIQTGAQSLATVGGTADALTLSFTPALTALHGGIFQFVAASDNATTTPTGNPSGLGAKTFIKGNNLPLAAGDIKSAMTMLARYDSVLGKLVLLNPATGVAVASASVAGLFKNLSGWADGLTSVINYTVDEIVAVSSSNQYVTGRNLVLAINWANSGANGLDTGTVATNNFYSLWAIYNPTTTTWAGIAVLCPVITGTQTAGSAVVTAIASTALMRAGMPVQGGSFPAGSVIKSVDSGTQITLSKPTITSGSGVAFTFMYDPVMPSGYTYKARIGAAIADSTANKYPFSFTQNGRKVRYKLNGGNTPYLRIMASGPSGNPLTPTYTSLAWGAFAPITAASLYVLPFSSGGISIVAPNNQYGGYGQNTNPSLGGGANSANYSQNFPIEIIPESANIYYAVGTAGGVAMVGWEDNL